MSVAFTNNLPMNRLAQLEERNGAFENITEPLKDSVFHSRGELLWKVKHYLDKALQDPNERANARRALYDYLRAQLGVRRSGYTEKSRKYSGYLYPTPESSVDQRELTFSTAWTELADAILVAADRLWRDEFLRDPSDKAVKDRFHRTRGRGRADAEVHRFELICQQSHTLMHLWLETNLLYMRAMRNVRSGEMIRRPRKRMRTERIAGRLESELNAYFRKLADWKKEIQGVTGLPFFFGLEYGDVQWFRALSKEFGPSSVHVEETGWITLATDARTELRYQYFKARMRENWKANHRIWAVFQWLFILTTGFGTRLSRFVITALIAVLAFSASFFLNDWLQFNGRTGLHFCPESGSASLAWWEVIIKYLYVGISNLTSLGSDSSIAPICNTTASKVLLIGSSVFGYFLLAMLAAIVIQIITESD